MSRQKSAIVLGYSMLFLTPFALIGLGTTLYSFSAAAEWTLMQSWVETPATLNSLELKTMKTTSRKRKGKSYSYRVVADYQYDWQGKQYTADRVALFTSSDSVGDFHQRVYQQLRPHLNKPNGAICFVNPSNPTSAVLNREARWKMFGFLSVFSIVFGGLFVALLMGVLGTYSEVREKVSRAARFPDEPWNWHPQWKDGRVQSDQKSHSKAWDVIAIWLIISCLPTSCFSTASLLGGDGWAILGLIPTLIAVLVSRNALKHRKHIRDYGIADLRLREFPMRAGLQTTLAVVFPDGALPHTPVKSHVSCVQHISQNNKSKRKITWEHKQEIPVDDCRITSEGLSIAVPIRIPKDARKTTTDDETTYWELVLTIPTPSKPMTVRFRLPVF